MKLKAIGAMIASALFFVLVTGLSLPAATSVVSAQPPGIGTPSGPGGPPVATQDPNIGQQPPFASTQVGPPGSGAPPGQQPPINPTPTPTFDPFAPTSTTTPMDDPFAPTSTPTSTFDSTTGVEVTPEASPTALPLQEQALEIALNVRQDLDLLALATVGEALPPGWNGTADPLNPELAVLIRLDLELLVGALLGANERPEDWFGVVGSTPYAVARDLRHDLELLADTALNAGSRPAAWIGDAPIMRCDRSTQALVDLLALNGVFNLQADRTAADFCEQAAREVSLFVEINYLANPNTDGALVISAGPDDATITDEFAVAFADRGAGQRFGQMPIGTVVQPVARSYAQFSAMMLVRGDTFEVFVEYTNTDVTDDEFVALPNVDEGEYAPFCNAAWCEGS